MNPLRLSAPAKINLRLVILEKQASGYHSVETLYCGIDLCDVVELYPGDPGVQLEVEGDIETGPTDENLVVRAARAYFHEIGRKPAVRLRLMKRIPSGAGLAGGSSDAAATLALLDAAHDGAVGQARLREIGGALGSDVAFFLTTVPFALGWNRGERLLEIAPPPERPVLLVTSGAPMSTREAFGQLSRIAPRFAGGRAAVLPAASFGDWSALATLAVNDFEAVADHVDPHFRSTKKSLLDSGARIAMLTGSGSTVFAIFDEEDAASRAEAMLADSGRRVVRTRTLRRWPRPVGIDPPQEPA